MTPASKWPVVQWNRPKLARFKRALAEHPNPETVFPFDGRDYLVQYAHYLVAYLESVFARREGQQ